MEFSERMIKQFDVEGYSSVYEWQDSAGTVYPEHEHTNDHAVFVTDGSITFEIGKETREVKAGERYDIPAGTKHSAIVGPDGWIAILAEK